MADNGLESLAYSIRAEGAAGAVPATPGGGGTRTMADPVTHAIDALNEALERDAEAITRLVNTRVECNDALAAHPTVQVGVYGGVNKVGVLGLLNAALGDTPAGVIGAKGSIDSRSGLFRRVKKFVDLRLEGVDVIA